MVAEHDRLLVGIELGQNRSRPIPKLTEGIERKSGDRRDRLFLRFTDINQLDSLRLGMVLEIVGKRLNRNVGKELGRGHGREVHSDDRP